jgi:hypothetical protein
MLIAISIFNQQKGSAMQTRKSKRLYHVTVEFNNGVTRTVKVRAVTREIAEKKALKFHPHAKGVKRDA